MTKLRETSSEFHEILDQFQSLRIQVYYFSKKFSGLNMKQVDDMWGSHIQVGDHTEQVLFSARAMIDQLSGVVQMMSICEKAFLNELGGNQNGKAKST